MRTVPNPIRRHPLDTQNHFYGHTATLAAYSGLSRPRHVAGLIQHGWTTVCPIPVKGDQASLARAYLRTEGPATVCLHYEDIHKPDIVGSWLDAGHRVVTAGPRHDPDFLSRILALVLASERVVSNRLMTPVLYAASLGRDVGVYGDPLSISAAEIHGQDAIGSLWPELHGQSLDRGVTTDLARAELGFKNLLEPVELRSALGWTRRSAGPAMQYWAGAPLRKTMNVLGLGERDPGSTEKQVGASPLAWLKHPMSHLPRPLPAHAAALDPLPAPILVAADRAEGS